MSLIDTFAAFFHNDSHTTSVQEIEADKVLLFVFSLVNQESLLSDEIEQYHKTTQLSPRERELAYIPIYLAAEAIILANKPLVVKDSYTKETLRALVSRTIHVQKLSKAFQLLFLPEKTQLLLLFEMGSDIVTSYILTNLGMVSLRTLLPVASEGTVLSFAHITDQGVTFADVYPALKDVSREMLLTSCQRFFHTTYTQLAQSLGEKKAEEIFNKSFSFIKSVYSYEFVALYLDMLPGMVLEDERMQLLSRQELERRVGEAVASEKEKRALAEDLARQLQKKMQEVQAQNVQVQQAKETMMTLLNNAKEMESALQKERDRARAVISSMGEGMMVVDASLRISFINLTAEKLLVLEKTQGVGQLVSEVCQLLYQPTGSDKTHVLAEALQQGITSIFHLKENFIMHTSRGTTFPVSLTLSPLPGKDGAVLLFHDITGEVMVKESIEKEVQMRTRELLEEQAKLTASINSLVRGFIMTDTKGTILMTNTILTQILGTIRSPWTLELIQKKLGKSVDLLGLYAACLKDKQARSAMQVPFGKAYLQISLNPFFLSDQKNFLGVLIQLEDITEDVLLQRSRDEFFSIASHELRTPLTSIRGNVSLIKQFYPKLLEDKKLSGMIDDIHSSTIRLIKIVNDFLNLSRLELGKIIFKKELFDLVSLAADTIKEVGELARVKKLRIMFDTKGAKQAFVFADKDRVREVITNLLSNAIKFTDVGIVTVIVTQEKKTVSLAVTDTGKGIPLINQSLLFRKFQQASDNIITRDSSQSTGLGLYISKLMMQGMNGDIVLVSSVENKGTTFKITLPVGD